MTREKWKAVPTEGLSGRGLRWPPRQDPGHIPFSDSKSWKFRQVMHSEVGVYLRSVQGDTDSHSHPPLT